MTSTDDHLLFDGQSRSNARRFRGEFLPEAVMGRVLVSIVCFIPTKYLSGPIPVVGCVLWAASFAWLPFLVPLVVTKGYVYLWARGRLRRISRSEVLLSFARVWDVGKGHTGVTLVVIDARTGRRWRDTSVESRSREHLLAYVMSDIAETVNRTDLAVCVQEGFSKRRRSRGPALSLGRIVVVGDTFTMKYKSHFWSRSFESGTWEVRSVTPTWNPRLLTIEIDCHGVSAGRGTVLVGTATSGPREHSET